MYNPARYAEYCGIHITLKLYCNTHELLLLQCCLSERAYSRFSLVVYLNPEGHVYLNQFLDSPSKQNVK